MESDIKTRVLLYLCMTKKQINNIQLIFIFPLIVVLSLLIGVMKVIYFPFKVMFKFFTGQYLYDEYEYDEHGESLPLRRKSSNL